MAASVQTVTSNDNSVSSLAYGSNVTTGNLGILWIRGATGAAVTAVTDSLGSTWTKSGLTISVATGDAMLWWAQFGSSGANTVSLTGDVARMDLQEVSGLTGTISVDSTNRATGTSTSPASGSISPAVNAWIFSGLVLNGYPGIGGVTAGSGFTGFDFSQDLKYFIEYQNSVSGGTYNGQWTLAGSDNWGSVIVAFKGSGGGGGSTAGRNRMLMGFG